MTRLFEELDYQPTPIGALTLRRRHDFALGKEVYEIKLGEEFLMSSAFTASEIALADLGLAPLAGDQLDVVVGGLGLGYTARAVLQNTNVRSLIVVDMLAAVIGWHTSGLLPLGQEITSDPRCTLVEGDFFEMARGAQGFDPSAPGRQFDAILADIDHSPEALLDARSTSFYRPEGLRELSAHLKPGGLFGLWSNDKPDPAFTRRLQDVFAGASAEAVTFDNPLQDAAFTQTVYLARKAAAPSPAA